MLDSRLEIVQQLPNAGNWVHLPQFFTPENVGLISAEIEAGADGLLPFNRRAPKTIAEVADMFMSKGSFKYCADAITLLSTLATEAYGVEYNYLICSNERPEGHGPYRVGGIGDPLTFTVVRSGEATYKFGGWHFSRQRHRGKVEEINVKPGDVVCVNNNASYRKRLLQSSVGIGERLILDFFTRDVLYTDGNEM